MIFSTGLLLALLSVRFDTPILISTKTLSEPSTKRNHWKNIVISKLIVSSMSYWARKVPGTRGDGDRHRNIFAHHKLEKWKMNLLVKTETNAAPERKLESLIFNWDSLTRLLSVSKINVLYICMCEDCSGIFWHLFVCPISFLWV